MRPKQGGDFGERVVRDLLLRKGGLCTNGAPTDPFDLTWHPRRSPGVFVEVKACLDKPREIAPTMQELRFSDKVAEEGLGWALVRVVYTRNGAKRGGVCPYRPISVESTYEAIPDVSVRMDFIAALAAEWTWVKKKERVVSAAAD